MKTGYNIPLLTFLCLVILTLSGCATRKNYDYSKLIESSPRSIVVIPPANNSIEVNAPYIFLSTISKPLAEKGYYVFPVSVIDAFLKENGLPTPAEMNQIPLNKIREHIGADAVLYVTIDDWGQKYQVVASRAVVSAKLKLVDTRTGETLWDSVAHAEHSGGNSNGGGLAGLLVSAIAEQVVGSMVDRSHELSKMANEQAINHKGAGLLNGPYAPKATK